MTQAKFLLEEILFGLETVGCWDHQTLKGILYLGALLEEQFPVVLPQQQAWFGEAEDLILQTLLINFYQVILVEEVVELHVVDMLEAWAQCYVKSAEDLAH